MNGLEKKHGATERWLAREAQQAGTINDKILLRILLMGCHKTSKLHVGIGIKPSLKEKLHRQATHHSS
jgi:hypothetical protein